MWHKIRVEQIAPPCYRVEYRRFQSGKTSMGAIMNFHKSFGAALALVFALHAGIGSAQEDPHIDCTNSGNPRPAIPLHPKKTDIGVREAISDGLQINRYVGSATGGAMLVDTKNVGICDLDMTKFGRILEVREEYEASPGNWSPWPLGGTFPVAIEKKVENTESASGAHWYVEAREVFAPATTSPFNIRFVVRYNPNK